MSQRRLRLIEASATLREIFLEAVREHDYTAAEDLIHALRTIQNELDRTEDASV